MVSSKAIIHPDLDLVFSPSTSLSFEQIWRGWTDQEFLPRWFCPRPWNVIECRIDLKSGGEFYTRMQGPQGEVLDNHGCIIEVIPTKRLVTTNIFQKGLRSVKIGDPDFPFVIEINDGDLEHKYVKHRL